MQLSMTRAEREAFLAAVHVGVMSIADGDVPLTVPVWYGYQPGGQLTVITGRETRKTHAVRKAGRFSLCAQVEQVPYQYVTVSGPAVIEETSTDERRQLARRYLGPELGDAYIAQNPDTERSDIAIRMTPERWLTVDYAKAG